MIFFSAATDFSALFSESDMALDGKRGGFLSSVVTGRSFLFPFVLTLIERAQTRALSGKGRKISVKN